MYLCLIGRKMNVTLLDFKILKNENKANGAFFVNENVEFVKKEFWLKKFYTIFLSSKIIHSKYLSADG